MNRTQIATHRMYTKVLPLAAAALLACGAASAQAGHPAMSNGGSNAAGGANTNSPVQDPNAPGQGVAGTGAMQDKTFAKKALAGGMAEVQLGQLAQQKGNSDDVKKFGQTMVEDHTKLNDQMKPIAASIGVQPPADLTKKDKELMMKLQGLSGDDFDKAYIRAMLKDHKQDDKEFQTEVSNGQNPEEKDAAMKGDQVIKQHLQMVEDLAKSHNVVGGDKSSM